MLTALAYKQLMPINIDPMDCTSLQTRSSTEIAAKPVFSVSHWFWLSFAALAVAGGADMVSVYIRGALVQFSTPDPMRGRVNAVNMLFIGSSNELGEFRAGTSAAWLGAVPAAVFSGLYTLGVVAIWVRAFPTLRKVDQFEEAAEASATRSPAI